MEQDDAQLQGRGAFDALCETTARWLEGEGEGGPDPETADLVPYLSKFNRLGYLTDHSQPGESGGAYRQRAQVSGYCDEATSNAIRGALVATDLVVLAIPALRESWVQVAISRVGNAEETWGGGHSSVLEERPEGASDEAVRELADMWFVEVIDPVWGRNDLLWPTVHRALDERPVRELGTNWSYEPPPGTRLVSWEEEESRLGR